MQPSNMQLASNEVHVCKTELTITDSEEQRKFELLSSDERARALRYVSPLHRKRFIAARATLREILSQYLAIPPEQINFIYTAHKKPMLDPELHSRIQFNVAHSEDLALYAFNLDYPIGIDIEKIKNKDHQGVAKKYFSDAENKYLIKLSEEEKSSEFYRIWCAKEAICKALGTGLSSNLSLIATDPTQNSQSLKYEDTVWRLSQLNIDPAYKSMLASHNDNNKIFYWHFFEQTFHLIGSEGK